MKFTHTQHITGYTVTLWQCGLLGKPCAMRKERYCCLNKVYSVSDQGQSENIRKRLISWWMDGQTDGQIDGQKERKDKRSRRRRDGQRNGQTNEQRVKRKDGQTDRKKDGRIDRWRDGRTHRWPDWQRDGQQWDGGREGKTNGRIDGWIFDAEKAWVRG